MIRTTVASLVLVLAGSGARADIMFEAGGGLGLGQFGGNERDEATSGLVGSASVAVGAWVTPRFAIAGRLGCAGFLVEDVANAFPQLGAGVIGRPSPGWSLGGGASFVPNGPGSSSFSIDLRVGFITNPSLWVVVVPQVFSVRSYVNAAESARDQYVSLTVELVYRR